MDFDCLLLDIETLSFGRDKIRLDEEVDEKGGVAGVDSDGNLQLERQAGVLGELVRHCCHVHAVEHLSYLAGGDGDGNQLGHVDSHGLK